jgi:pimeloyl-ACP methyl ester carboxylesterase
MAGETVLRGDGRGRPQRTGTVRTARGGPARRPRRGRPTRRRLCGVRANVGRGAEDYRAWLRPWGFAPEQIAIPVDVWGGEQDQLVTIAWPRELARRIPYATLHEKPGGHFLAHRYYSDIFAGLLG